MTPSMRGEEEKKREEDDEDEEDSREEEEEESEEEGPAKRDVNTKESAGGEETNKIRKLFAL